MNRAGDQISHTVSGLRRDRSVLWGLVCILMWFRAVAAAGEINLEEPLGSGDSMVLPMSMFVSGPPPTTSIFSAATPALADR